MSYTIPVASALNPAVLVTLIPIEDAPNFRRAKRQALFLARKREHIAKPMVFDPAVIAANHRAAVEFRQQVLASNRQPMPNLNGSGERFWAKPTTIADCYDER